MSGKPNNPGPAMGPGLVFFRGTADNAPGRLAEGDEAQQGQEGDPAAVAGQKDEVLHD
jgi:hypothetical protein